MTDFKIPTPILYYYRAWKRADPQFNYPELFNPNAGGWFHDWKISDLETELIEKEKRDAQNRDD